MAILWFPAFGTGRNEQGQGSGSRRERDKLEGYTDATGLPRRLQGATRLPNDSSPEASLAAFSHRGAEDARSRQTAAGRWLHFAKTEKLWSVRACRGGSWRSADAISGLSSAARAQSSEAGDPADCPLRDRHFCRARFSSAGSPRPAGTVAGTGSSMPSTATLAARSP